MRPKPTIFLSYRRDPSADLARLINDRLKSRGYDVFLDVEDINGGRFAAQIEREIINRDCFIVILTPKTLGSEWVCREIATALRHRKQIIPLIAQGFDFSQPLPPEIDELKNYDAVRYDHVYGDAAIDRLVTAIGGRSEPQGCLNAFLSSSKWQGIAGITGILALIVAVVALIPIFSPPPTLLLCRP